MTLSILAVERQHLIRVSLGRGDEMQGLKLYVTCPDPTAKESPLVRALEARGVNFVWE
jgi:hypothetical protein